MAIELEDESEFNWSNVLIFAAIPFASKPHNAYNSFGAPCVMN
jgi:hypothetical protein